jgi:hypothetical protein
MAWPDWFSSPFDTVRTVVSAVLLFVVLGIANSLIGANIRKLAEEQKWDNLFLRWWASMTADWETTRRRWWLWLLLGVSGGLAGALWLISAYPNPPSAEEIAKATEPIQRDLRAANEKLKAMTVPASEAQIADAKAQQATDDQKQIAESQQIQNAVKADLEAANKRISELQTALNKAIADDRRLSDQLVDRI